MFYLMLIKSLCYFSFSDSVSRGLFSFDDVEIFTLEARERHGEIGERSRGGTIHYTISVPLPFGGRDIIGRGLHLYKRYIGPIYCTDSCRVKSH